MRALFISLWLTAGLVAALATDYFVGTGGSDVGAGTSLATKWATIGKGATTAANGDTVYVVAGTYNEGQVAIANSGVTLVATNGVTFKGGFDINGKNNVGIFGFTITHEGTAYNMEPFLIRDATNVTVMNNVITNVNTINAAITCDGSILHPFHWCLIASNYLYNIGYASGVLNGTPGIVIGGNSNVVEYNWFGKAADFTRVFGTNDVVRNNYFGPLANGDFTGAPHIDGLQTFQLGGGYQVLRILFECNFMNQNNMTDSHGFIAQDPATDYIGKHIIAREQVWYKVGDYAQIIDAWPSVKSYNVTFVEGMQQHSTFTESIAYDAAKGTGRSSTNCAFVNSIFYHANQNTSGTVFYVDTGAQATFREDYNLAYLSGTPAFSGGHNIVGSDPLLVDVANLNFALQSGSPAKAAAGPLATAVGSGSSSTSLTVNDSEYFQDGWAPGVLADSITIGSGSAVGIVSINYATHVITLAAARTWSNGDGVKRAGFPDLGAIPFLAGYTHTAVLTSVGNDYTVTSSAAELVRYVAFFENGVLKARKFAAPFTYTANAGTTVTAKAFSRYASTTLAVDAIPLTAAPTGRMVRKRKISF
jgi:hypothetical protein